MAVFVLVDVAVVVLDVDEDEDDEKKGHIGTRQLDAIFIYDESV